jgi:hypothetical protein
MSTDCDPRKATAAGYAARFRIFDNINIGHVPGGDGFLHGPEITGSFAFDPKGNRSILSLDGQPGADMAAMRGWVDQEHHGHAVDETASTRIMFLNQYGKGVREGLELTYVTHANGSIEDRNFLLNSDVLGQNCSDSRPNPACCRTMSKPVRATPDILLGLHIHTPGPALLFDLLWPSTDNIHTEPPRVGAVGLSGAGLALERTESWAGQWSVDVWSSRGGCRTLEGSSSSFNGSRRAMFHYGRSLKVEPKSCQILGGTFWMANPSNPVSPWDPHSADSSGSSSHPPAGPEPSLGNCNNGFSTASIEITDFVPYPQPPNATWWGTAAGLDN